MTDREKNHQQKTRVMIAGQGAMMATLMGAFDGNIRAEPVLDTRIDDLFGADYVAESYRRELDAKERRKAEYLRQLKEQAEREKPIVDAAEAKRKRKAEKLARDAERMKK